MSASCNQGALSVSRGAPGSFRPWDFVGWRCARALSSFTEARRIWVTCRHVKVHVRRRAVRRARSPAAYSRGAVRDGYLCVFCMTAKERLRCDGGADGVQRRGNFDGVCVVVFTTGLLFLHLHSSDCANIISSSEPVAVFLLVCVMR